MKNWRYIEEHNVSASYGLATDEYLTNAQSSTSLPVSLRLYTYHNYSALSGRFQHINAEIDIEKCQEEGFDYSRRLTGGGAIIMGENQLGICIAASAQAFQWQQVRELYELFSKPIINALSKLGIEASFRSKNDLEVNNKKIAGLGVYLSPEGNIQFHTSLLIDMDIPNMMKVLKIPIQKYSDKKKIASVSQRLTSISKELGRTIERSVVIEAIKNSYAEFFEIELELLAISEEERAAINQIEIERYNNNEWIFQNSPQADMTGMSVNKIPEGMLRTYIGLKGNTIKSVLITGDFMDQVEVFSAIEMALKWSPLEKENIERVVSDVLAKYSTSSIKTEDIVGAIWRAGQRAMAAERYTYNGTCYYPKVQESVSES